MKENVKMNDNEHYIVDWIVLLLKNWKRIAIRFVIVSIVAVGVSLLLPKWYRAHTTILPPVPDDSMMGLSSMLSNLPIASLGIGGFNENSDLFISILNSRTVMEEVSRKFNLQKRYETKNMEETVRELRKRVFSIVDDEGTITLGVENSSPMLASKEKTNETRGLSRDMANYFIQKLDSINAELKVDRARNNRIFIEKRYNQNLQDLSAAEEKLKEFQQRNGVVSIPEQTKVSIEAAASLKGQISAKEIQLNILSRTMSKSHSEIQRLEDEISELKKKYSEYIEGRDLSVGESSETLEDFFLAIDDVPDLGLQYARLFREVTIQQTILEFLLPQYEEAKIQEAKDTPTVQILDPAVTPIKKVRPKRAIFVVFWSFLSLLYSAVTIVCKPAISDIKNRLRESIGNG